MEVLEERPFFDGEATFVEVVITVAYTSLGHNIVLEGMVPWVDFVQELERLLAIDRPDQSGISNVEDSQLFIKASY